jgi:hypothetical protein
VGQRGNFSAQILYPSPAIFILYLPCFHSSPRPIFISLYLYNSRLSPLTSSIHNPRPRRDSSCTYRPLLSTSIDPDILSFHTIYSITPPKISDNGFAKSSEKGTPSSQYNPTPCCSPPFHLQPKYVHLELPLEVAFHINTTALRFPGPPNSSILFSVWDRRNI